jgi:selenocysteine lyase/cysteine desulfurase
MPLTAPDFDIVRARANIPALNRMLELNSGTKGLTAAPVVDALVELTRQVELGGYTAYQEIGGDGVYTDADTEQKAHLARTRFARLLGADPDEVTFTGNASHSLNIAAQCLRWERLRTAPGRSVDVLISDHEYPTTNMLFHYLEETGKARLIRYTLSANTAETLDSLNARVTEETRIVVASHVDCNTGLRADAAAISAWCRERGIISFLDGAQAAGQFPIDLHAIGCDLYITNGHKWLFGPNGVGLLYVRRGFEAEMEPPQVGLGTIIYDYTGPIQWTSGARRFELAATRPIQIFAAMNATFDYLETFGLAAMEARQRYLTEWEKSSALASVQIHGKSGAEILAFCNRMLKERRAFLRAVPEFDALRLSMAYYNTEDEYERFFRLLEAL